MWSPFYHVRERQELARLDACEVLESPMVTAVSYARAVASLWLATLGPGFFIAAGNLFPVRNPCVISDLLLVRAMDSTRCFFV